MNPYALMIGGVTLAAISLWIEGTQLGLSIASGVMFGWGFAKTMRKP